jgi:cysteine-rich repeat protein
MQLRYVLLLSLFACQAPTSIQCPNGIVCPIGTHCALNQTLCIHDLCGNGNIDPGEICDDGNNVSCDGCSADCKSDESCGNGYIDSCKGEVCDDGDTVNMMCTTCSADCKSNLACGNSVVDTCKGEVCDHGDNTKCDGCSPDCKSDQTCGNGIVDPCKGEVCDHGDNTKCDGCAPDCKSTQVCGDGILDKCKGEICDDGTANAPASGVCPTAKCSADCKSDLTCGNGIVDPCKGEICDEGANNGKPGAGCSADCKSNNQCGNSVIDVGEQCDPGSGPINVDMGADMGMPLPIDTATCTHTCKISFCGDGYINAAAGETCDTNGLGETAGCNANCTTTACGDGIINTHAGEQCDTLGGADTAGCNGNTGTPVAAQCHTPVCGDGYTNKKAGEDCDTAGVMASNCNANCTTPVCGDGILNTLANETCDDGNMNSGDGCSATCQPESFFTCVNTPGAKSVCTPICGDGHQVLGEACDDNNNSNCGSCNSTCTASYAPAPAAGSITVVGGSTLRDGETVTIGDGRLSVVFEFVVSSTATFRAAGPGHIAVNVNTSDGAAVVAMSLATLINTLPGFALTATPTAATIGLANNRDGSAGNVPISSTVQSSGFTVTGMSGGIGFDCPAGIGCTANSDCASGVCDPSTSLCKLPSCTDSIQNGNETGLNCGGSCAPCVDGLGCLVGADCKSGVCTGAICQVPNCTDKVKNGNETDIDCGANCPACPVGEGCGVNKDCTSGWCNGSPLTCQATHSLTLTSGGNGSLSSSPAAIGGGISNCATSCSDVYAPTTMVTVTTTAAAGYRFTGWGSDCTGTGTCTVTMGADHTVSATFTQTFAVGVTSSDASLGSIASDASLLPQISCGTTCVGRGLINTAITLTATPSGGHKFVNWMGGPCDMSTNPVCTFTLTTTVSTTANFAP